MDNTDTITAVATAPGPGGVGIIRISGPKALELGLSLFVPSQRLATPESQKLYFGDILSAREGSPIDKGYLVFMKGPNSFTGEDVIELHCHGGPFLLGKILEGLLEVGRGVKPVVRLAEAGEFTKRAYLNGKIDLTEAEAVAEVIAATSDAALMMASGRLQGRLSSEIAEIKEGIVEAVTLIEAELDFSEEEIETVSDEDLSLEINKAEQRVHALISGFGEASAYINGIKVVITGRPNTGKSSLLNCLLKEERAIVTPIAGTTRDVIEESVSIKGLPARLMDTAGLRHGDQGHVDEVEAIGIERARVRVSEARIVLFVVDGSVSDYGADLELLESLAEESQTENNLDSNLHKERAKKSFILVANKSDKAGVLSCKNIFEAKGLPVVEVSALKGDGIEALEDTFFKAVTGYEYKESQAGVQAEAFITTLREKDALIRATAKLEESKKAVSGKVARECLALELRGVLDALGEVVGETTSEDILNRIFSNFCIGK